MAEPIAPGYDVFHGASLKQLREFCQPDIYGQFLQALGDRLDHYFGPEGPLGPWSAGVPSTPPAAVAVEPVRSGNVPERRRKGAAGVIA